MASFSAFSTVRRCSACSRFVSPSVTALLGYEREPGNTRDFFEFVHPADHDKAATTLARCATLAGVPATVELRFRHKDGSWRVLEATGRTLLSDTELAGVIVNSRDVTERVEAERKIRMQKTLLEAQGEASIDGILVVSAEGKILSFNQRFVELWNLSSEVVAARSDEAALTALRELLLHEAKEGRAREVRGDILAIVEPNDILYNYGTGVLAMKMPLSPPITNIDTKPSAKSMGVLKWRRPSHSVASQLNTLIPVGTAMTSVVTIIGIRIQSCIPETNMWCAQTEKPRTRIAISESAIRR